MFSKSLNANYPLKFIRLDPTNGVMAFNCGDVDLDDFILNRASIFQKHLLAVSYACVDVDDASKVYAYCSLANDRVALDNFRDKTEFNRFRKKSGFPNEKRQNSRSFGAFLKFNWTIRGLN